MRQRGPMRRPAVAALAAVAAAVTLGGCVTFQTEPTATQNQILGSVHVTLKACATQTGNNPPNGSCSAPGNSSIPGGPDAPDNTHTQILLGFRIPNGSVAPSGFQSSSTGPSNPGPQLVFSDSPSYAAELQRLLPAQPGFHWKGYISQEFLYQKAGEQNFTAGLDLSLPPSFSGAPFHGPFYYRPVVGAREFSGSGPVTPGDPVSCGPTTATDWSFGPQNQNGDMWAYVCVDDPDPMVLSAYLLQPTRDAGILKGASAKATAGKQAKMRFRFVYAGPGAPSAFTFSTATTVPGASAKPSPKTFKPSGDATKDVIVSFKVPKGTAKGSYLVTLAARLPDGETRTGTGKLTVKKPKK